MPEGATQLLLRFLASGVFVLLGIFPVLAAVGLIPGSEPVEPFAIPVALLFGLIFIAIGAGIVFNPIRALLREYGAMNWRSARDLAWSLLLSRANRDSSASAAGIGILALAYWLNLFGVGLPLINDAERLGAIVIIEILTIHAFPFMVVLLYFAMHAEGGLRVFMTLMLLCTLPGYLIIAWTQGGGIEGLFWLSYLLIPNVLILVRPQARADAVVQTVSRWCIKFALFMLFALTLQAGELGGDGSLLLGAAYFSMLCFVELWRIDSIPLDLALRYARLHDKVAGQNST